MDVTGPHNLPGSSTTRTGMALLEEVDNVWRSRWQFLLEEKLQRPSAVYMGGGSPWGLRPSSGVCVWCAMGSHTIVFFLFPDLLLILHSMFKTDPGEARTQTGGQVELRSLLPSGTSLNLMPFSYDFIGCFSCLRHKSVIHEQTITEVHGSA